MSMQVLQVDILTEYTQAPFVLMWNCTDTAHLIKIISTYTNNVTGSFMTY